MFYLDASVVVALHVHEPHTDRVAAWLRIHDAGDLAVSDWVVTEFASALSLKLRTGQIDNLQRHNAQVSFDQLLLPVLTNLPVGTVDFRRATNLISIDRNGLRAGDALHLAVAERHRCALVTLDQRFAKSAAAAGLPVADL